MENSIIEIDERKKTQALQLVSFTLENNSAPEQSIELTAKVAAHKKRGCSIPLEKRFQPGQSGNPHGRPPKNKCIPDILRLIGDEPASKKLILDFERLFHVSLKKEVTNLQLMLYRVHYDAQLGDSNARIFVAERTEGKVKDLLDVTTNGNDIDAARSVFKFEIVDKTEKP